ncbi:MAG: isochorismatase family protein [Armatimonadetes bacterium]|nr:isochorismatase family protein [Armatimonadota bacterium]
MNAIKLRLRYCNLYGYEQWGITEHDIGHSFLEVELPCAETTLVLVDVWDRHYLTSHQRRAAEIVREKIVPVADACRRVGIAVVHAPASPAAQRYEQWLRYAGDEELFGTAGAPSPWPPEEFRQRTGRYAQYAKAAPKGEFAEKLAASNEERRIMPEIEPAPGDFVVASGAHLRRLCRHRGILHLLYCGFATNMCVMARDYGIRAMSSHGYSCILLRDGTTGIESAETIESMTCTRAAIWEVEMVWGFTCTCDEVIAACHAASSEP